MGVSSVKWGKPIEQIIRQDILGKDVMTFAATTAKEIMNDWVPMDTGNLSNDEKATKIKNKVNIIAGETIAAVHYTAPYAAVVYHNSRGVVFKPWHHPLASKEWDKHAMAAGGKEKLVAAVSEYIKRKRGR